MEMIYSNVAKISGQDIVIHLINRASDMIVRGRRDICSPNEFLQIATLNLENEKTFPPHKHVWKEGLSKVIAQESWIVIKGKVKAILYDLDDTIIAERILEAGDCSVTFFGGHTYEILEEGTVVYEVKTGPYQGQKLDKEFI